MVDPDLGLTLRSLVRKRSVGPILRSASLVDVLPLFSHFFLAIMVFLLLVDLRLHAMDIKAETLLEVVGLSSEIGGSLVLLSLAHFLFLQAQIWRHVIKHFDGCVATILSQFHY